MSIVLSSIVEVSMNKMALWIHVVVDDWTAAKAIIASNAQREIYIEFRSTKNP